MKPFVKWAGGKGRLAPRLSLLLPPVYNRYIEPFCGGAALYFYLRPEQAILNDKNRALINCYNQIKYRVGYVIKYLNQFTKEHNQSESSEVFYYKKRAYFNYVMEKTKLKGSLTSYDAAVMIYLNKAGFNGMYRENSKGRYNIPFSKRKTINLFDEKNLRECSQQLQLTEIQCGDYLDVLEQALEGDFVFIDSPYFNTFNTYQAGGFLEKDHEMIARRFEELTDRGVYCMLTNSDEEYIQNLYNNERYYTTKILVKRYISCDGNKKDVNELIVTNYPIRYDV
ncbi:Dam family site-specific DNA-(adenine-N6)-methyltransferase [uncultured Veillonella sp.]|uniref:DNA adenine methylase n=1 Tax=uncultured Veillonella sp. TaxID=159268 RepID=UPI0026077A4A|nr:Dam family site-specific DNA-(adenine-N6)-methyltransferase [uncultured Veillonella sp.]